MRIPTGNFGNQNAEVIRQEPVNTAGSDAIGRATQGLAGAGMGLARDMQQERQQLARAQAANATAERDLETQRIRVGIEREVQDGTLNYRDARQRLGERLDELQPLQIEDADAVTVENLGRANRMFRERAELGMDEFVYGRQQDDYRGQFVEFLDTQGKLAGMPGANIEEINARGSAVAGQMAQQAGLTPAQYGKAIQDWQDQNWANQVAEKTMAQRNSIDGLRAIEHDLTAEDGFYQGKLDTNKRNALLSHAMSMRTQLENKLAIAADRADVKAQRALLQMDQQLATGVPATAAQWDVWGKTVQGSAYEADFQQRRADEAEIQQVLRLPINDQQQFAQRQMADLQQNGGSVQQVANARRLNDAINANVKQLQETPLLYAQARTGVEVQPLDLSLLGAPDGAEQARAMFADRIATLGALRKQYGDQVQQRPLLPQEAQFLTAALSKTTPQQQGNLFQSLHAAIGDSEAYRGVMQQIAPDSPVKAAAGVLMGYSGQQTLQTHWLRPDDHITARKAATTLLVGESLINRTGADNKTDGKPLSLSIPSAEKFGAEFQAEVGDAFAGRPQAFMAAQQAVRAYYVGTMAETGSFSEEIDTQRMRESIKATLGQPLEYRNNTVILPWGMDESTFRDQMQIGINETLRARGMTSQQINAEVVKFPRMDVVNFGDGEYLILDGARRPYLPGGQPVTVKVGQ